VGGERGQGVAFADVLPVFKSQERLGKRRQMTGAGLAARSHSAAQTILTSQRPAFLDAAR